MATITCLDCAAQHEARKDCKFCPYCRLLRNLMYCAGKWKRPKKCRTCETRFRPIHARDLSYCADCELRVTKAKQHDVDCALCHRTRPAAQKGVKVCLYCAKDPGSLEPKLTGQPRVIGVLQRRQDTVANRDTVTARA